MKTFQECINAFSSYVSISSNGTPTLYNYLNELYNECIKQYNGETLNNLPLLYTEENFLCLNTSKYYGTKGDSDSAKNTMVGWCIALVLSELKPKKRNDIFKIGYELGGYTKQSGIFGYSFKNDPNIARLVAAAIYAAMRGLKKPSKSQMRNEIGVGDWNYSIYSGWDTSSSAVTENDFYIDFSKFMASAPGLNTTNVSSSILATNEPTESGTYNFEVDRDILKDTIVKYYNLDNETYGQAAAQATSDKDLEVEHFFGPSKSITTTINSTSKTFTISPIFGSFLYSTKQDRTTNIGKLMHWTSRIGMAARHILQDVQRYRPGCSTVINKYSPNSGIDASKWKVLANFDIENYDGSKEPYTNSNGVYVYYYDANGNWTHSQVQSASQYVTYQQGSLENSPNSYPSGHSSGIQSAGQTLIEMFPDKADLILRTINRYAIERTIARYHWTSDTIQGRVLGSAQSAVTCATTDYDSVMGGNYTSLVTPPLLPDSGSNSDPGGNGDPVIPYNPGDYIGPGGTLPIDTERPAMILNQDGTNVTVSMVSSYTGKDDGRETDMSWGGVGTAPTIRLKRDIIDTLNWFIKPIKGLQDKSDPPISYNLLTSYAYFHNDIVYDLKWLWANYKRMADNYKLLIEFKNNIESWTSIYNSFSSQYSSAKNQLESGGPYYIKNGTTTIEVPDDTQTDYLIFEVKKETYYSKSINDHISIQVPIVNYPSIDTNSSNYAITYESNDSNIGAIRYENGNDAYILVQGYGTITITGHLIYLPDNSGVDSDTYEVQIADPSTPIQYSVSFSESSASYNSTSGGLIDIKSVTVSPSDYISRGYALRYSTDDSTIATIYNDNGVYKINVKRAGSVDITCELLNGTDVLAWDSYTLDISIETHPNTYDLTIAIANQNIGPGLYSGTQVSSDTPLSILYVYIRDTSASGNNTMIFDTSIDSTYKIYLTSGNGSLSTNITKDSSGNNLTISHSVAEKIKKAEGSSLKYVNMRIGNITTTADFVADWYDDGFQYDTTTAKATLKLAVKNLYPNSTQPVIINYSSQNPFNNIHELSIDSLNEEYYKEKSNERTLNSIYKTQQDGDIIYGKTITIDNYVLANMPTFPSLPGSVPTLSSAFNNNLVPIENFIYTWEKDIPTYNMPYKYINMTTYISYIPNIQNVWQTMSYSMLKWKNNQVDDHPALLYEIMDFDD